MIKGMRSSLSGRGKKVKIESESDIPCEKCCTLKAEGILLSSVAIHYYPSIHAKVDRRAKIVCDLGG